MLFAGYRRGDANDVDGYVASIAAVLSLYEPELIRRVTDPRTGISTREKFMSFMPNSGELKVFCDEQAAIDDRYRRYQRLPGPERLALPKPPPGPGSRTNLFVPVDAPQYPAMVARAATDGVDPRDYRHDAKGVWVVLSWVVDRPLTDPTMNPMVARMAEGGQ